MFMYLAQIFSIYSVIPFLLYKNWVVDRHELQVLQMQTIDKNIQNLSFQYTEFSTMVL